MSELTNLIKESRMAQELIPATVRIPEELSLFIEDLSDQLSLTKQETMLHLLKEGIAVAKVALNLDEVVAEDETCSFYLLNTNRRFGEDAHKKMLIDGTAAAFCNPWKHNINRIKSKDVVFLYSNGQGIVAVGRGTGETLVADEDECHFQKLTDFQRLEKPLTAKEFRKILNCNFPLLRTMSPMKDGQKILDVIQNRK